MLSLISGLLLSAGANLLIQENWLPPQDPRQLYHSLLQDWRARGISTTGARVQIGNQAASSLVAPPAFEVRNWTSAPNIPWAIFTDSLSDLPTVEGVHYAPEFATPELPFVLNIQRDQIITRLKLDEQNRLREIIVLPIPERGIREHHVQFDLPPASVPAEDAPRFKIQPLTSSSSPNLWPTPLLKVTAPVDLAPRARYEHLMGLFKSAQAVHFDATAQIKLSTDETIQDVGRIQLQLRFARPRFGKLEMLGWAGDKKNPRQAHSIILGGKRGLVYLDSIRKTWIPVQGLQALSDGLKGFDPLGAWAKVDIPPPLSISAADVPGKEFGWTGLAVESKHLTSVYRFDPQERLVAVAVARKGPQNQRQVMEYRFHGLELLSQVPSAKYAQDMPAGFHRKDEPLVGTVAKDAPLAESEFEQGLLVLGDSAPPTLLPAVNNNRAETLSDLRGQPILLAFWLKDSAPCLENMEQLSKLWPRIQKRNPSVILRKIPASETATLQDFKVRYFPTFYLINPSGEITFRMVGWNPDRLLAAFEE